MATETIDTQATNDEVVTFDEKQQAKLDEIVKKASARAGSDARVAAEQARNEAKTLKDELDNLKVTLSRAKTAGDRKETQGDIAEVEARLAEVKSVGEQHRQQLEDARKQLAAKDQEVSKARQETLNLKKNTAIQNAANKSNFVRTDIVAKLTEENISWDDSRQKFIVLKEDGSERLNNTYEPMTLEEFYSEYAHSNPFLVRGDVKGGTGSTGSQRFDVSASGKFTVDQIFGAKSNGKLANDLAKTDIKEYHRLKAIAKGQGLIA